MNPRQLLLIPALLLFIFTFSCEEPAEEVEDLKIPTSVMYDFSGAWKLTAWIPIDCPGCFIYSYYISGGDLRFDSLTYDLKLTYTFNNLPDSIVEQGSYIYSSDYFVSWGGASTMFTGEIIFTPGQGDPWTVQYQIEYPENQDHNVIFKNFIFKNDTTEVMFYWEREF